MVEKTGNLEDHLAETDPDLLDRARREAETDVVFSEASGFGKANSAYDLLRKPEKRRIINRPEQHRDLLDADVDVVVHMGCHVVQTPHIIQATMDVLETIGYAAVPLGGFSNCCGVQNFRIGDLEGAERVDDTRFENMAAFDPSYVVTECSSCYAVTDKLSTGYRSTDFEVLSMIDFLNQRVDELLAEIESTNPISIALHDHYDANGWTTADQAQSARELYSSLPGVEITEMDHSLEKRLPCNFKTDLSQYEYDDLSAQIYREAIDAGADRLINFWHACHRELAPYEFDRPIETTNYATFIAERLGYKYDDLMKRYKRAGLRNDIDAIVRDCREVFEANDLDESTAREIAETLYAVSPRERARYASGDGPES